MRRLLVSLVSTAISLFIAQLVVTSFQIVPTYSTYLWGSVLFLSLNWFLAPVLKLLLFPLNLLTLGLFRWLINVALFYFFDMFYVGVTVSAYHFPGISSLPPIEFSLFWTYVLLSLITSLSYGLISHLLKGDTI